MHTVNEDYSVVVCGGGLAGFSAALAAARHGASTVLIQDRPVLGGNSSSEVRVTPHGAAAFHGYARETGIIAEALIEERATNHAKIEENGWTNSVWDLVLYDMVTRTDNLTLHLNTAVETAVVEDGRIVAITARTANAELIHRIAGDVFIDCTGDGTLGALAGNPWRMGMETSAEFGERNAPELPSADTMGSSLHFKTVDTGRPTSFTAPDWAVRYDDASFFVDGGRLIPTLESGYWWIEIGAPWDTLHQNEEIRHELTRHVLGIWDYLKNRDPYWSPRATSLALDWVGQVPGKRESRRLEGRHLLTETDLAERRVFEDEVAFGGWYIDLHTTGGLLAQVAEPVTLGLLSNPKKTSSDSKYVGPFGIPLRALTSGPVDNLFFAGRNISATHVALGATRVMGTTAAMGQAVGVAAARNHSASDVAAAVHADIAGIQQALLRDGAFLPNSRNQDQHDLARRAVAEASSSDSVHGVGPNSANWLGGIDHWRGHPVFPFTGSLERRTAQWIARGARQELDRVRLALSNATDAPVEVDATFHAVDTIWEYRTEPGEPLATTTLTVPPGGPHWVDWEVGLPAVADSGYVRLDLAAEPGVEWHLSSAVLPGQIAAFEDAPGHYRRFGGGATLSFEVEPPQRPYEPSNVLTGVTRPHRSTNQWRSDPLRPLPQWLEIRWNEPETIEQVQVTFAGHLLREYHAYPAFYRDPQCARDYELQAWVGGAWVNLIKVEGNYQTRVVHDIQRTTTDRLRLVVHATNGDPSAGVYEIRAYDGPTCTGWARS